MKALATVLSILLLAGCVSVYTPTDRVNKEEVVHYFSKTVALVGDDIQAYCTGAFIDNHRILTAAHCVEDKTENILIGVWHTYNQGATEFEEVYVYDRAKIDLRTDLALLVPWEGQALPVHNAFKIADEAPEIGDYVFVVGHPRGYPYLFTDGRVTNPHFVVPLRQASFTLINSLITFGNSGGPVINQHGELMGITSFLYWGERHLGGAVHLSEIKKFLQD